MSQPCPGRVATRPRVYGSPPGSPVDGNPSSRVGVPSGGISIPASESSASVSHTSASGCVGVSLPDLRRTAAASASHSACVWTS